MIKIRKATDIPASLNVENPTKYDSQDVQAALVADQDEKCYLCEQQHRQNFQVEHLKGKDPFPDLKYVWTNLFSACPYCNGRKPNSYDILDPTAHEIENLITHRLDMANKRILIETLRVGAQEDYTVKLLHKLFNGVENIRDIKGQRLYDDLQREIIFFLEILNQYKGDKGNGNKQKVVDALLITKEYLAFKYWILKDHDELWHDFEEHLVWNKLI